MSGRRKFHELTGDFTPERRGRIEAAKAELIVEMALHELRQVRDLTQEDLAKRMDRQQPAIAKIENRPDMYISTLRNYIEAMGGRMKIVAQLPEGEVTITNFARVEEGEEARPPVVRR